MKTTGVHRFLAGFVLMIIAGCASKLPLPAAQPGTVHFALNGSQEALSAFQANLDKRRPSNCVPVPPTSSKPQAENTQEIFVLYRCANTNTETFAAFGMAFVETVRGNRNSAQASLEPVYLTQLDPSAMGLTMTATTTSSCVSYNCGSKGPGPWYPHYECLMHCP